MKDLIADIGLNFFIYFFFFRKRKGSGTTLTNNKVKNITNVIRFLENSDNVLKRTTRKTTIQEGRFIDFLRPLITACLPLTKVYYTIS